MRIEIETPAYNTRRFKRPGIAKMRPGYAGGILFQPGQWLTRDGKPGIPGFPGLLCIDADSGEILIVWQRDYRRRVTKDGWYVVQPDGGLERISRADAYRVVLSRG